MPTPFTALTSGGTITWTDGNSTTIATPKDTSPKKLVKKCVAKYGAGTTEVTGKAAISSQVGVGDTLPGNFTAEVCIDSSGNLHALKPITAT